MHRRVTDAVTPRHPWAAAPAWLAFALTPLLAGALLYVAFRPDGLLGWRWAAAWGIDAPLRAVRAGLAGVSAPEWIAFSLPDALYCFALAWSVSRVTRRLGAAERRAWSLAPWLLGPGAEIAQWIGVVPGTYDPLDLAMCVAAVLLGLAAARDGRVAPAGGLGRRT